jgi:transposase
MSGSYAKALTTTHRVDATADANGGVWMRGGETEARAACCSGKRCISPRLRRTTGVRRAGEKRGSESARTRNPTDKGEPGSKHHVLVDRNGIPLAVAVTAANVHDSRMLAPMLDAVAPVRTGRRGRPRRRPAKLPADNGYDNPRCRDSCVRRGVEPRIARKGVESKTKLGTHRWIVERTLAWLARYRRLAVRYERLLVMHRAWLHLACALIRWNQLQRVCSVH